MPRPSFTTFLQNLAEHPTKPSTLSFDNGVLTILNTDSLAFLTAYGTYFNQVHVKKNSIHRTANNSGFNLVRGTETFKIFIPGATSLLNAIEQLPSIIKSKNSSKRKPAAAPRLFPAPPPPAAKRVRPSEDVTRLQAENTALKSQLQAMQTKCDALQRQLDCLRKSPVLPPLPGPPPSSPALLRDLTADDLFSNLDFPASPNLKENIDAMLATLEGDTEAAKPKMG
ncbi:MAG: hypothetical protein P1U40_08490 [Coxiellaceae bacterium]|nr:hypothetical protein [Coxiellaceae bacterium]